MDTILRIQQGETWAREIAWNDNDGAAVNLAGATAVMQLRERYSSSAVTIELSSANGRIAIDPAGKITLKLSAELTSALSAKMGVYDLEVRFPNGSVTKILRGRYLVSPQVTR
ncbi:hypothetical protein [Schauerella aestuarii]|uniref:hypothetical protein n=1 Tax=Schauerella aestuarii TaxID=2511204 RepID=UPI00136ACFD4|nr:hypothetical protein [Achromobacter aestuarii]MYZ44227.1 hypothetical protein [Achromobacter aestuarii]